MYNNKIEELKNNLTTTWLGQRIIYQPCMDSTNRVAKEAGDEGACHGTVVITEMQTAGRGRMGRQWASPEGNLYASMLLRPSVAAERVSCLTLVAAVAVAEAILEVTNLTPGIKWPNDVVVAGKKLCGILTESKVGADGVAYVVVGVGINVNQSKFSVDLSNMATSLSLQCGDSIDIDALLTVFLAHFEYYYDVFLQTADLSHIMERYNALLVNRNQEVRVISERETVRIALGVDSLGGLVVQDMEGNQESIISGEVSVRGMYGYV